MSVINGQAVNAAISNASWISKNTDDSTPSVLGLSNTAPASGASITNTQRELNSITSFVGSSLNQVYNYLPTWTNNTVGSPTDNVKQRVEALTAAAVSGGMARDSVSLSSGVQTVTTTFATAFASSSYAVTVTLTNMTDAFPQYQPVTITSKTTTGFTATWDSPTDSSNYKIEYLAVLI